MLFLLCIQGPTQTSVRPTIYINASLSCVVTCCRLHRVHQRRKYSGKNHRGSAFPFWLSGTFPQEVAAFGISFTTGL